MEGVELIYTGWNQRPEILKEGRTHQFIYDMINFFWRIVVKSTLVVSRKPVYASYYQDLRLDYLINCSPLCERKLEAEKSAFAAATRIR